MSRWQRAGAGLVVGMWITAVLSAGLYILKVLAGDHPTSERFLQNLASEVGLYGGIVGGIAGFVGGWRELPRWPAILCYVWAFLGAHAVLCVVFFVVNQPAGDWAALGRWLWRTAPVEGLAVILSGIAAVAILQRFGALPAAPKPEPPHVALGARRGSGH